MIKRTIKRTRSFRQPSRAVRRRYKRYKAKAKARRGREPARGRWAARVQAGPQPSCSRLHVGAPWWQLSITANDEWWVPGTPGRQEPSGDVAPVSPALSGGDWPRNSLPLPSLWTGKLIIGTKKIISPFNLQSVK